VREQSLKDRVSAQGACVLLTDADMEMNVQCNRKTHLVTWIGKSRINRFSAPQFDRNGSSSRTWETEIVAEELDVPFRLRSPTPYSVPSACAPGRLLSCLTRWRRQSPALSRHVSVFHEAMDVATCDA
jgi:hypothetical protein